MSQYKAALDVLGMIAELSGGHSRTSVNPVAPTPDRSSANATPTPTTRYATSQKSMLERLQERATEDQVVEDANTSNHKEDLEPTRLSLRELSIVAKQKKKNAHGKHAEQILARVRQALAAYTGKPVLPTRYAGSDWDIVVDTASIESELGTDNYEKVLFDTVAAELDAMDLAEWVNDVGAILIKF